MVEVKTGRKCEACGKEQHMIYCDEPEITVKRVVDDKTIIDEVSTISYSMYDLDLHEANGYYICSRCMRSYGVVDSILDNTYKKVTLDMPSQVKYDAYNEDINEFIIRDSVSKESIQSPYIVEVIKCKPNHNNPAPHNTDRFVKITHKDSGITVTKYHYSSQLKAKEAAVDELIKLVDFWQNER